MRTRLSVVLFLIPAFITTCRPSQDRVDRITEGGVIVTVNHREPYHLQGEPSRLRLEKTFVIDFESTDIAQIGIWNIGGFDIDSLGNIYIWSYQSSSEHSIFKFSPEGRYVTSIGRKGQGPGEIVAPVYLRIDDQDRILISDAGRQKIVVLKTDGDLSQEIEIGAGEEIGTLLANGKILARKSVFRPDEGVAELSIVIRTADLKEIAELHHGEKIPNWARAKMINGVAFQPSTPPWSIAPGRIFVGNSENGYEFLVYDLDGNLAGKIRKEYGPVAVAEETKKRVLNIFDRPQLQQLKVKEKVFFPDSMPPYQYFFTDDQGRLLVMTHERGQKTHEYRYDIFSPGGVFSGRTSLENSGNEQTAAWGGPFEVKAKDDRLYYMRAKGTAYQELVVCKIYWTE